jgi:ABC-type amino acid transport substrate-binding protein
MRPSNSFTPQLRQPRRPRAIEGVVVGALLVLVSIITALPFGRAGAQTLPKANVEAAPQAVPGFWDPRRRPERPDLSRINVIRFLTETDYPPFNFTGPDGNPAGFNVDLARAICDEIKVTCTIQMRRFETLLDALSSNRGDAIIASIAVTPQMRARVDFSKHQEAASRDALLSRLTTREAQVLERIVAGRLNKQIADDLGISIKTVEAHRANIMEKLNANTVADLLKIALGAQSKA